MKFIKNKEQLNNVKNELGTLKLLKKKIIWKHPRLMSYLRSFMK